MQESCRRSYKHETPNKLFGLVEFSFKCLGFSTLGFNQTSKVVHDKQGKRYEQGTFEFDVALCAHVCATNNGGLGQPVFIPLRDH